MSLIIALIVGALMVGVDQITKAVVLDTIASSGETVPFIKGVLSFYYTANTGAGFSIFTGQTVFLIVFTVLVMALVVFLLIKGTFKHPLTDWGFCLVLSGGIGNLIDRVFNGGAVVDFIKTDFIEFPIFNVADICVTVGAALIILYFLIDLIKESKTKKEKAERGTDNP